MATLATRITSTGTYLVNGSFDEITQATVRVTTNTVYASSIDEVSLAAGAVSFNGTSQYLSAANATEFNFGTNNFTVECWFFCTTAPGASAYSTLITTGWPTDSQGIYLGLFGTNQIGWLLGNGGWFFSSTPATTYSTNTWNHLALVRVGTTYTVYLNGTSIDSTTNGTALTYSNNALYLGGRTFQYYTGYMSNVRVVKGTAVYTANFTPPQAILPAVSGTSLLLNVTNSTNFIKDNSINNVTVTNNGTATWSAIGPFNRGFTNVKQRQVNDGTLEVSDQFDEFTGAPIVDSSLILWVDAAQPASYPGSGTTLFDLSGSGSNFTTSGTPVAFTQSQGGAMVISATGALFSVTSNMTIAGAHTVSCWVQPTIEDTAIRRYLYINTAVDAIVLRNDGVVGAGAGQLHYYIRVGGSFFNVRVNSQVVAGQTANFVGTWDGATMRLYKNGQQVGSLGSVTGTLATSVNTNYRFSTTTEGMVGDFYQAQVYNRALSADEVQQNFNALRRRYGI
jgi:hypothetical protein